MMHIPRKETRHRPNHLPLWISLKNGDRSAFEELYKLYRWFTDSVLYRNGLWRREDREDARQEIWIRVWQAVHRVRATNLSGFNNWLGVVTKNEALKRRRRVQQLPPDRPQAFQIDAEADKLVEERLDIEHLADTRPIEDELISETEEARKRLACFTALDQKILNLLHEGYLQEEIAEMVGRSQGTISTRIKKMRTRLKII